MTERTGYEIREGSKMLAERIQPDPLRRADDLCANCLAPLPQVKPQRGVDPMLYAGDPFCSGECCRAWHGVHTVVVPGDDPTEKRGRYERKAA